MFHVLFHRFMVSTALFLAATISAPAIAQTEGHTTFRFGVGVGTEYGGLGGQVSRTTSTDRWTLGAGLTSTSTFYGETYGIALTYQRLDWIGQNSTRPDRHGLGVFIGPVGSSHRSTFSDGQWDSRSSTTYGAGVLYNFFPQGANQRSWILGLSAGYGSDSVRNVTSVGFNLGYQF